MKALYRLFVILSITAFAVGLGLDLHENRICHMKKKLTQLEMENQKLLDERYSLQKELTELQKERNRYIIEAVRSRRIAKNSPTHG
jgi:cell division protein FtsB